MNKRGQITIFIIIGLIILFSIIFFAYYPQNNSNNSNVHIYSSPTEVKTNIQSCFESVSENSLLQVSIIKSDGNINSLEDLETQMIDYISGNIISCISDNILSQITFNPDNIKVDIQILRDRVKFRLNWPIIVKEHNKQTSISDFGEKEFFVRMNEIYATALDIISLYDLKGTPIMKYESLYQDIDVVIEEENNDILYNIYDLRSRIKSKYYVIIIQYKKHLS
ncbi:MAG: hypothetical protein ABIG89_07250 [Candidatus Woesearchaeota archaeon]